MSDCFQLNSGVPQGSSLSPALFLMYASGVFKVVDKPLTNIHSYADDTQLCVSFKPTIRKCLTYEACKTLVHTLGTCYLDHCNVLLHDVSISTTSTKGS